MDRIDRDNAAIVREAFEAFRDRRREDFEALKAQVAALTAELVALKGAAPPKPAAAAKPAPKAKPKAK